MNDAFLALPIEKQERIINAALEVFSKHRYKDANTEDIASLAGISKGSLFYYFKNKETLFLYLFDYVTQLTTSYIVTDNYLEITDFFEIMNYGAKQKIGLLSKNPYIFDFVMQCFFQDTSPVSDRVREIMNNLTLNTYTKYFSHIDTSKFKEGIEFKEVYEIMTYAIEGYVRLIRSTQQKLDMNMMLEEFYKWERLFKRMAYKEEFLDE